MGDILGLNFKFFIINKGFYYQRSLHQQIKARNAVTWHILPLSSQLVYHQSKRVVFGALDNWFGALDDDLQQKAWFSPSLDHHKITSRHARDSIFSLFYQKFQGDSISEQN